MSDQKSTVTFNPDHSADEAAVRKAAKAGNPGGAVSARRDVWQWRRWLDYAQARDRFESGGRSRPRECADHAGTDVRQRQWIGGRRDRARELYLAGGEAWSGQGHVVGNHASFRPVRCEQGYSCSGAVVPEGGRPGCRPRSCPGQDADGRQGRRATTMRLHCSGCRWLTSMAASGPKTM